MGTWKQWLRQPQRIWLRRAAFQIHLWVGLLIGLYVVVLSLTGSLLVYRNESRNDHHWIGFRLRGRAPNTSAIGAEVELEFAAGRQLQVVTTFSGFSSQNDRRLHFGLGDTPGNVKVRIRWPGGETTELDGLELDRYHVIAEGS